MTADQPIDLASLRERAGGDESLVQELLGLLRDTLPGQRATIAEAMLARDCVRISRAAHALKGGAGSMAAGPVASACADLEIAGIDCDLDAAAAAWERLDKEIGRLAAHVDGLLGAS